MAIDKEKLIKQIMREAEADGEPVTRAEAEEMAEMEIKANGIKNYVVSEERKPRKPKERKVDTEKLVILEIVKNALIENGYNATIEKEIALHFDNYTLKLTRHRK